MRAEKTYRVAIVGASSLAGKELSDALSESPFAASNFTLLDDDVATGQIAAAGDEISFIQKIDASSFEGMDLVFFAGDSETATKCWEDAKRSGAGIIDLTYTFEGQSGVPVRSPWIAPEKEEAAAATLNLKPTEPEPLDQKPLNLRPLDLKTAAIVPAHPAAVMLALAASRLAARFSVSSVAATVLEPASQYGQQAMDELHQQTVSLLSFQSFPRERYDAQVAFNLLAALGEAAKIKLASTEARMKRHYGLLRGGLPELALQLIHAPVFHGYVASIFIVLQSEATVEEVELALAGDHVDLVSKDSEPPSNLTAAGQNDVMIRVESAASGDRRTRQFKLLLAADNLKLAAANAISCARELARLRPLGQVQ